MKKSDVFRWLVSRIRCRSQKKMVYLDYIELKETVWPCQRYVLY